MRRPMTTYGHLRRSAQFAVAIITTLCGALLAALIALRA